MWPKETKPECCIDPEPLPSDIKCMTPDICKEMARLYNRHRQTFIKNKRIVELARINPRHRVARFVAKCPCYFRKDIQVIRLEQRLQTRTEQLAYPKARQLFLFKEEVKGLFSPERLINLNRLIRKSLFSVYSRLANIRPPIERIPIPKWDRKEWAEHTKKLKKLAKPKVPKKPPKLPIKRMPLKQMKRYKYLAQPKKDTLTEKPVWVLTIEMRKYKPTKRIKNLARPVIRDTSLLYQELPIQIPINVLKAKASKRISELAEPSARRTAQSATSDLKENPFSVSPNALKTKASKRTNELAEPKEYENKHIREDPYAISKAALNCKAKPRTNELAKPRKR